MSDEREFRVRPGRIRSTRAQQARPFIAQALAAARKAGGGVSRSGKIAASNRSRFGSGQVASLQASRRITPRSRGAVVKARVVRHTARAGSLSQHLTYLRREGVTRDGEQARLFGPESDSVDVDAFTERCREDRHHFRFIVSPDDALEMEDLRAFTRDLARQMERDLGTGLDWVAVDHWNTEHPHVHLIVRGRRDDGQDLVISRDYIKEGMRDRARDLITQELGPRTELDIRRSLERQIEAERWTELDRQLVRETRESGIIDMAPVAGRQPDEHHALRIGRLRKLEALGLAKEIGNAQWVMEPEAEATLRALGERGDIIKRMHRALTERGIERGTASYVLAAESLDVPVIGRLVARGLDDELHGSAYAIVDGGDGQYDNAVGFGQRRILLVWNRLIFPNGRSIVLERQPGTDAQGYAGLEDGVDMHWWDLAKAIGLSTLLSVSAELAMDDEDELIQALQSGAQDTINDAGQEIIRRQLQVAPTLTIRPGFPVRVMVTCDLVLEPYRY